MATPAFDSLKRFFETAPAAKKATKPLQDGAEVGLELDGVQARFVKSGGAGQVLEGPPQKPDFTLWLPDGAVSRVTAHADGDVGEIGIEFFKLVLEKDPALRVRIRIDAPTTQLLHHGYLGVLAQGGMKVTWWLLKNGVKNPKAAIDRLRHG